MFNVNCAICNTFITLESQEQSSNGDIISVAKMLNDKMFCFGLSGVLEFIKPPENLKPNDEICNSCMESHKDNIVVTKTVKCMNCTELYQPCHTDITLQGWGCSADVYEHNGEVVVYGGWGSKHDDTLFKVLTSAIKPGGDICDKCIDAFIKEGSLVKQD